MNRLVSISSCIVAATLVLACPALLVHGAEPAPAGASASELAARMSQLRQGSSLVRLRMEMKGAGGAGKVLQLQIKERRTRGATELVYQVLFPKERQGEAVLLQKVGNRPASGTLFVPPNSVRSLGASQMTEPLFGSALSYEDVIENFFAWADQSVVGSDTIDRIPCQILESKPGKGERSSYTSVRTWVDTRRNVPLRIEKYRGAGNLACRIDTTRIVVAGGRQIPANLTVRAPGRGPTTDIDGSRIRHGVTFSDREFTPDGLQDVKAAARAESE